MHLLRSSAIGTEVIDETEHQIQGGVSDLLIDPDRGTVIALFIARPFAHGPLVLQTQDILSWGQRVHIRDPEVLGELQEIVRLAPFLEETRTLVSQRIQTKSGVIIGTCSDVQFNTKTFAIEWIFPRKFFRRGAALPASDILEVTEEAIIVKDQGPRGVEEVVEDAVPETEVKTAVAPAAGRSIER